jgi:hypothetical protein
MTIKYKLGRAILRGEEKIFPRLVRGEALTDDEFERKVSQKAARGLADAAAIFIAMREVLLEELREKQAVHVPGLGLITLVLNGDLDEDQRLVTQSARLRFSLRVENSLADGVNISQRYEYVGE